jgi:hypothetical protein
VGIQLGQDQARVFNFPGGKLLAGCGDAVGQDGGLDAVGTVNGNHGYSFGWVKKVA